MQFPVFFKYAYYIVIISEIVVIHTFYIIESPCLFLDSNYYCNCSDLYCSVPLLIAVAPDFLFFKAGRVCQNIKVMNVYSALKVHLQKEIKYFIKAIQGIQYLVRLFHFISILCMVLLLNSCDFHSPKF